MMSRPVVFLSVALLIAVGGCRFRCSSLEAESNNVVQSLELSTLEKTPGPITEPVTNVADMPAPATVANPEGEKRYLGLAECIALALEHGTVGVASAQNPGQANDGLVAFSGRGTTGTDSVRVLALDPARAAVDVEAALSRFDARWLSGVNWTTTDTPIATSLEAAQSSGSGVDAIQTQAASVRTGIIKPLPTGGVAGITFRTDYEFSNVPGPVNPAYRPRLNFQFEQPLLQGFGVEINQLRAAHPGSLLTPFSTTATEGILITRIRIDQSRAEFQRNVHHLLLNVEAAYWNLYAAYWNLYSRDLGLQQSHEVWRREKGLADSGRSPRANDAQARGQYELFRSQRLSALGTVLESERQLRLLLGLPHADGARLVPADAPTLTPLTPNWHLSLREALKSRPELALAREQVKVRQFELFANRDQLLPDLRLTGNYEIQGLGSRLDGPGPDNALRSLAQNRFQNWNVGLQMDVPIGFREAHSRVRAARLNLAGSLETLKDQEKKVASFLEAQYRRLIELQDQISITRAQREAFGQQVELRYRELAAGRDIPLPFILEAQRSYADALGREYGFIGQYNSALAGFEFAKGTIMRYHNVVIGEGSLLGAVQVRAVEHFRERSKAIVLRERAAKVDQPPCSLTSGCAGLPELSTGQPPSLIRLETGKEPPSSRVP